RGISRRRSPGRISRFRRCPRSCRYACSFLVIRALLYSGYTLYTDSKAPRFKNRRRPARGAPTRVKIRLARGLRRGNEAMFKVSSTPVDPTTSLLRVEGEIDGETASKLNEAFESLYAKGIYRIILDIEKITFIASAGLGCLLSARDVTLKHAGNLILAG